MWENSHKFHLSQVNQRCIHILPTTLIWPMTGVGFFRTARQRSLIHRVASLWLVRLNFAFWAWNPTECTQTLTRCPYLPVSRVWIPSLYIDINRFFSLTVRITGAPWNVVEKLPIDACDPMCLEDFQNQFWRAIKITCNFVLATKTFYDSSVFRYLL